MKSYLPQCGQRGGRAGGKEKHRNSKAQDWFSNSARFDVKAGSKGSEASAWDT